MAVTETHGDRQAIRERVVGHVRDYLREQRGVEVGDIDDSTRFKEDLDLDSLDLAALAVDWEDDYGVTVEDERVVTCSTVGKAVDLVQSLQETA